MLKRLSMYLLVVALMAMPFVITACSEQKANPLGVDRQTETQIVNPGKSEQHSAISYPGWYKELPVPWMPQMPPKDPADSDVTAWSKTKNCGQTCVVMIEGYKRNICYTSSMISIANTWLYSRFSDSRYGSPYGYYTGFTGRNELGALVSEKFGRNYAVFYGTGYDDIGRILAYINVGQPVICGVRISGGNLVSSGGTGHWVVAVGWDQGTGEIILNDPGTNRGNKIHYKFATFYNSWCTSGRIFIPVS